MEYGYPREVLEGTVHQIEIIADTADARIGMKTWKYRIFKSLCRCSDGKEEHTND